MTKEEKKMYADKKPVAVYGMSNWGGLEILDIVYGIEDYIISRFNFGEPDKTIHKTKINYSGDCPTFRVGGYTIPLNECMHC